MASKTSHFLIALGTLGLVAVLTACSTPAYKPASGSNGFGYSEAALEEGRYRITFRGRDFGEAYDFALLRAAEVTLAQGYTWFRITNAFSEEAEARSSSSQVILGTGYGHNHSRHGRHWGNGWGLGIGIPLGESMNSAVHILDIQMGKGDKPEGERVYDAASVKATIGARVAPAK